MLKNKQILMSCIFLSIATLAVFWQVNNCDFINFDDTDYILINDNVQNGFTMDGIRWAFTTGHASNWHPLTWISHMLDVQLFGINPQWHHLTNLLFHLANTLLLFLVLHRMTKAPWESAFVAALFALHPLHVESVAWVAERKDVLSAFFWMLTMGAYCYYVERPKLQRYLIVVLFFALGLMAKPMLVTLPFVLLLLDYWPLLRFQQIKPDQKINSTSTRDKQKGKSSKKQPLEEQATAEKAADSTYQWALIRPLIWEKIPFFVLAALSSIVTYTVQQQWGAVESIEKNPLTHRIANAIVSYITYIGKMIWPNDLAVYYPYPQLLPTWQVFGAALFLIAVTLVVIWKARRIPYLVVGWLWYIGTLVPVIGIVQVGMQARADRYTYLPLIGLFIMATWGISELSKNWRYRKEVFFASSTVVLICFCIVTWIQVGYWRNSITLFDHTVKVTENNEMAYILRGNAYLLLGSYRQAIGDYDKVIELRSNYAEAHYNRGCAYAALGDDRHAIEDYDKAIEVKPGYADAYINRGNAYSRLGNYRQAIGDYDKAIESNTKYAEAYFIRGHAYSTLGNNQQAIEDVITAARLGHKNAQNMLRSQGMVW